MPEDLKDAHIQDVADVLSGEYRHAELTEILRRFDAEHLRFDEDEVVDDISHVSRYNRVSHWLRESNGTPTGRKLLAHLVENTQLRVDQREALEEALAGSRFVLSETDDGLELMLRISATAEKEVKDQRGYIEAHAPNAVLDKIEAAEDRLTNGDPDNALQEGRRALEALTKGSYNEALDELYSETLIEKWDGNGSRETRDWRMLYTPYGYCSTIGSHTSGNDSDTTLLQAQTGVILVEEAIHYVLRIIEEAEEQGIQLDRWVV